ncbi:oligosaccharide flippase family protein [Falsirhodobacter deserti]|uniref:oligosaccharide flippase family protein n=1 Tax=Falsirhodobacter deserti TaxID=1365611 RepID=UPI000FE3AADF|nr:oligosaccharide flippase family protein [Falsirhodobacter deserti]
MIWTTGGFAVTYALRLASTLILTRLLAPEVFGIMAISLVFLTAIHMFSDLGTVPSIIRSKRGDDPDFLTTAWTIHVVRGFAICAVICLIAWPVSRLYEEPILFPLLCVLSLSSAIEGFISISVSSAQRHVKLERLTVINIVVQLTSLAINVAAAYWLRSPWALVIGSLAGSVLRVALGHLWLPRFPHRLRFEPAALSEIVGFGRWVLLATILTYLGNRGIDGIMGLLVPVETLGKITIAFIIAWAAGDLTARVLTNVVFPTLSRIYRERPDDLPRAVTRVRRVVMVVVLPVFVLLVVGAHPIANLLYDDRYASVGYYLGLAALSSGIQVASLPYNNLLLTLGLSRSYSMLMLVNSMCRILGLFIGFHFGGDYGMLAGLAAGSAIPLLGAAVWLHRTMRQDWLYETVALLIFSGLAIFLWQEGLQPPI